MSKVEILSLLAFLFVQFGQEVVLEMNIIPFLDEQWGGEKWRGEVFVFLFCFGMVCKSVSCCFGMFLCGFSVFIYRFYCQNQSNVFFWVSQARYLSGEMAKMAIQSHFEKLKLGTGGYLCPSMVQRPDLFFVVGKFPCLNQKQKKNLKQTELKSIQKEIKLLKQCFGGNLFQHGPTTGSSLVFLRCRKPVRLEVRQLHRMLWKGWGTSCCTEGGAGTRPLRGVWGKNGGVQIVFFPGFFRFLEVFFRF